MGKTKHPMVYSLSLVRIVLFWHFNWVIYLEKNIVTSNHSCHLHNNTPLEINVSIYTPVHYLLAET